MANYATTTHVYALNSHRTYDTTSTPTSTQISSTFIPAVTGEMNMRFAGAGITVPITTSATHNAYLYVNRLASLKVACIAENATFMGGNKNESPHAAKYCEEYEMAMQAIEKNPDILTGLIDGTYGVSMDSYEYSNTAERRTDDEDEPFKRDEDRW